MAAKPSLILAISTDSADVGNGGPIAKGQGRGRAADLPLWIGAYMRMLEYFQGCPAIFVPDNLRSGVTQPCRYEPTAPVYQLRGICQVDVEVQSLHQPLHSGDSGPVPDPVQILYAMITDLRNPREAGRLIVKTLTTKPPYGVKVTALVTGTTPWWTTDPEGPAFEAARTALKAGFGEDRQAGAGRHLHVLFSERAPPTISAAFWRPRTSKA